MSFNVYHNPQSVTIGSTSISGVRSITVAVERKELRAAGDGETHESVARFTVARTRGTIDGVDPELGAAVGGLTGTLSFVWKNVRTGGSKTVTITACSLGGYEGAVSRDAASRVSIPFVAESPPAIS